jgi:iron(III) transport system ATP-binding protein
MVISDRVVVMREGRVLQEGSPREIYGRPTSRFVASFIGVANLWPARLSITEGRGDQVVAVANLGKLVIAAENVPTEISGGGPIVVVARPEAVVVSKQQVAQAANSWPGVVRVAMFKGAHVELLVEVNGQLVRGRSREELAPSEGDPVYISISPQGLRALPADNDERERKEDHGDEEVELGATEGVLMNGGPPKPGGVPAPIT